MIDGYLRYVAIRYGDKSKNYKGEAIVTIGDKTIKCTTEGLTPEICYSNLIAEVSTISEDMNVQVHSHPKLSNHPNWRNYATLCCDAGFEHETNFIISLCPKCGRHVDSFVDKGTNQTELPF